MAVGRGTRLDTLYYELEARTAGLEAGVAKAKESISGLSHSTTEGAEAIGNRFQHMGEKALEFHEKVEGADLSVRGFAKSAVEALGGVEIAIGVTAIAMAAIAVAAVEAAEKFETAFLPLESTLNLPKEKVEELKEAMLDLSTETPRTAAALGGVAGALSKIGETDPEEIAKDVRILALAGDALGQTDLGPLTNAFKLIKNGFDLTGEAARTTFAQIVALTHGQVDIEDFGNVIAKSGSKLSALGVSATDAAAAVTTLVKAGVSSKNVTTGLLDLLDKSGRAEADALDAAVSDKEGTAKALRIFGDTVNETTIRSKGLVGALGDLYDKFGGNIKLFEQAKLNVTDFTIAQKASAAASKEGATAVLTHDEAIKELTRSAEVNNKSAAALVQILKNDLSVALIDLGTKFLPPVITLLTKMADLFNHTKGAARDIAAEVKRATDAAASAALNTGNTNAFKAEATTNVVAGQNAATLIAKHPGVVDVAGFDLKGTRDAIAEAETFERLISKNHDSAAVFGQALEILDEAIKGVGDASEDADPKVKKPAKAFTDTGTKAVAAAESFDKLLAATKDYAASLGEAADPVQAATTKLASQRAELEKLIPLMKDAKKEAEAHAAIETVFGQAADDVKRLADLRLEKLGDDIDTLAKKVAGGANAGIIAAYDAEIQKAQELQTAAKAQHAEEKAFDAAAIVAKLTTQKNAAIDNAAALKKLADAQDVVTRFLRESDNAALGVTVTYDQYRAALDTLIKTQREAEAIINDSAASDDEKTAAKKRLTDATNALNEVQGKSNTHLRQSVSSAELLGDGLSTAAASALTLLQLLGKSDSALARMASAAGSLGGGLSGLGKANNAKDGDGNPLTGAAKLAAFAGPTAQVIGGLTALAGSLDLFGNKAREHAKELRDAAVVFNRALEDFAHPDLTALQKSVRDNLTRAEGVANAGAASDGITGSASFSSAADITKQADQFRAVGAAMNRTLKGSGDAFLKLAAQLDGIAADTIVNEGRIAEAHKAEIASSEDDLKVRALVAEGRLDEAQAMRDQLARQRELADATAKYAGTAEGDAYIQHLKDVQAEEKAAADAAARDPLKNFASQAKAFGLTGAEYLNGLIAATKKKFGEVADAALDGLDLSTQAGLDALRAKITALWTDFNKDGIITDSEQAIIDGLGSIYTNAVDIFDSLDKRIARSLAKADTDNSILGGDAKTQFGRTLGASKGFDAVLDGILSGVDLNTSAGAEAFGKRLQKYYETIAADGIDATEQSIVDLIKTLLGGLDSTIAEAKAQAEKDAADAETARTARLAKRQGLAARDSALNDETGVAAVVSQINGLAPALSDLFSIFDLQTPASITSAKDAIKALVKQVDSLSDPEVIAKFGVTRDELTNAILDLDNSLDGLANTAKSAAQAAVDLANAQADVTASSHDAFLRASGNDRQADIESAQAATAAKVQRAKDLNVSPAVIDEILRTGALTLAGINTRYDAQAAQATAQQAQQAAAASPTGTTSARDKFTASSVTSITEVQGLSLVGAVTTSNAILRTIDARLAAAFGAFPSVRVPALPAGLGGFGGSNSGISFAINISLNGPIVGQSAESGARQLADALLPHIDRALARGAGYQAKLAGTPLAA